MRQMSDMIQSSLDRVQSFVDEVHRRMYYHAGGEIGEWEFEYEDFTFYSEDLEIELAQALANEVDQEMRASMTLPPELITGGGNLIQPVEYKLILPEPLVPVHQRFIGSITQEDIERWRRVS